MAIAHGVPVGLTSVIVQSQALFTIAFAAIAFGELPTRDADDRHRHRRDRPSDDLRHRRLRFQRRRLRRADDLAGQLCDRQSAAAARAGRADVRPVRLAVPGRGGAAVRADAGHRRAAADLACAVAYVADRPRLHARSSAAISTSIAYWLWGRLLRDYPAAQVVPFALLVPFVGSAASSIVFGETFGPLRLAGMVTVVGGIAVMLLSKRPQVAAEDRVRAAMSHSLLIAFVDVRRRDVLHAGAEQHHAAVVGADLRLPPHAAAHRRHHHRLRLHGRRGRPRPRRRLHRLSGAADHPEICRRRLSDLSRRRDRDVRSRRRRTRTTAAAR